MLHQKINKSVIKFFYIKVSFNKNKTKNRCSNTKI